MKLLTTRLLRDDPHAKNFIRGNYDGVTSRTRWVVQSYTNLLAKQAHLVYEELERLAEEHGMDVRRLVWPLQKESYELMSLPLEFRIAAQGAFAMLSLARNVLPGEVTEARAEALDEIARTQVPDNMAPPYESGGASVKAVLLQFAKWAQYTFRNRNLMPAWRLVSKNAAKDIEVLYEALYGSQPIGGNGMHYLLWDTQEGLLRTSSPFSMSYATRMALASILRWVLQMRMYGRTKPVVG